MAALPLAALLLAAAPGPALAQADGIFAGLAGAWSGEGSAKLSDGSTAPLRCRASYAVSGGGDHLDQTLACASGRQSFAFRIALDQTNGAILGEWQELTHQIQGGVSGQVSRGRIKLATHGQGFSAEVSVVTRPGRQSLAIAGLCAFAGLLRLGGIAIALPYPNGHGLIDAEAVARIADPAVSPAAGGQEAVCLLVV